jgi:glycosyltransferase involved in cell wall biosynthesis
VKILVPTTTLPAKGLTTNAAPIVIRELLSELAYLGHEIEVLPIIFGENSSLASVHSNDAIEELRHRGILFHEPICLRYSPFSGGRYSETFSLRLISEMLLNAKYFTYPVLKNKIDLHSRLEKLRFDTILVLWSEPLTILFSDYPSLKVAYYGNPDPKSFLANLNFLKRNGGRFFRYILGRAVLPLLEIQHLRFMNKWDVLANVAQNDALYYSKAGHPKSFYVQNTWVSAHIKSPHLAARTDGKVKIIASVGKLNGTANAHGFEYLLNHLLPELRRVFTEKSFELHIFGTGEPHPALVELWNQPEIIRRGFVEDLDAEISDADLFLVLNNATEFNVCHTRYLHAWSIGSCLVGHASVREAMPEFSHGENSLLGHDAEEIALLIKRVSSDEALRLALIQGGRLTHSKFFAPRVVAARLHSLVSNLPPSEDKSVNSNKSRPRYAKFWRTFIEN